MADNASQDAEGLLMQTRDSRDIDRRDAVAPDPEVRDGAGGGGEEGGAHGRGEAEDVDGVGDGHRERDEEEEEEGGEDEQRRNRGEPHPETHERLSQRSSRARDRAGI